MNDKLKTASRASCLMVLALALGGPRFVAASDALERVPPVGEPPSQAATNLPPLLRPATLTDAEGTPETGLVDPFRRRGEGLAGEPTESAPGKDGLLRTSLGEISSEFRILAITIPQDTNTPRSALIQFHTSDEPILVHEGDLVHVDRLGAHGRSGRAALRRGHTAANGRAVAPRPPQRSAPSARARGLADLDLEEQLRKYVFYLNVKHIEPTFIEVYHNKKSPDETIRLNW